MRTNLRNIAIIAHIDHGKTTLVDKLLQQTGNINMRKNITELVMDSNDLEKERGITIFSKYAAINWKNYYINIVDTPGHADFGGEVERVMSMVDSVLLLVDAIDGPMPQTRFVTEKAFNYGLNPIVVINKIDRCISNPDWVINKIFDLFVNLGANNTQLDFPIVYLSAINGRAGLQYDKLSNDLTPLFEVIVNNVKISTLNINNPFQMQISQLDYNNYSGIIGIGRIKSGCIKPKQNIIVIDTKGQQRKAKINQIMCYYGLKRIPITIGKAGDIIAVTGINNLQISDTLCDPLKVKALPLLKVNKPTISMYFSVNTSPFCGKDGQYITSRHIIERLYKEKMYNVALNVEETNNQNLFLVSGRGELHLSVLIEQMRREGFEMSISRPNPILRCINNVKQEPFDFVSININKKHQGIIIEALGNRKGEMKNFILEEKNRIRLEYIIPSRSLIGFFTDFMSITSGTGQLYHNFSHYDDVRPGNIVQRTNGVLISNGQGKAIAYSLYILQERGKLFINHGEEVYEGQIIGINSRSQDLTVNCLTGKKLTNMRAAGLDEAITLVKPIKMSLEQAITFINDDELVEVTPKSIRLRKIKLKEYQRKHFNKNKMNHFEDYI